MTPNNQEIEKALNYAERITPISSWSPPMDAMDSHIFNLANEVKRLRTALEDEEQKRMDWNIIIGDHEKALAQAQERIKAAVEILRHVRDMETDCQDERENPLTSCDCTHCSVSRYLQSTCFDRAGERKP